MADSDDYKKLGLKSKTAFDKAVKEAVERAEKLRTSLYGQVK